MTDQLYCPRGKHKKWDRMPLDRVTAGGWACPGILPDGTDCGYQIGVEPVVTTTMFTGPEDAAWHVAVRRGLGVGAADIRALLAAAEPLIRADERAPYEAMLQHIAEAARSRGAERERIRAGAEALARIVVLPDGCPIRIVSQDELARLIGGQP